MGEIEVTFKLILESMGDKIPRKLIGLSGISETKQRGVEGAFHLVSVFEKRQQRR